MLYKAAIQTISQKTYYDDKGAPTTPRDFPFYVDSDDLKGVFDTEAFVSWKTVNPLTASEDAASIFSEIDKKKGKTLGKIQELMMKGGSNVGGFVNTLLGVATGQAFINTNLYYAYESTRLVFNGLHDGLKLHVYFTINSKNELGGNDPWGEVFEWYNKLNGTENNAATIGAASSEKNAGKLLPIPKKLPGPTEIDWSIASIRKMCEFAGSLPEGAMKAIDKMSEYAASGSLSDTSSSAKDKRKDIITEIKDSASSLVETYRGWLANVSDKVAQDATNGYAAFYLWINVSDKYIVIGPFVVTAAEASVDMSNVSSGGTPLHAILNIKSVEYLGKTSSGSLAQWTESK